MVLDCVTFQQRVYRHPGRWRARFILPDDTLVMQSSMSPREVPTVMKAERRFLRGYLELWDLNSETIRCAIDVPDSHHLGVCAMSISHFVTRECLCEQLSD